MPDTLDCLSTHKETNLLILGGGPAGISTALHLLQLDTGWAARMILLEKEEHPRHKLCGGGLTFLGLRVLKKLGFGIPLPIPHVAVNELHFRYQDRVFSAHGSPLLLVFERAILDEYLLSQARQRGLQVQENERVLSINSNDQGVQVKTDQGVYLAQVVVGADGSKGISRKLVGNGSGTSRTARTLEIFSPQADFKQLSKPPEVVFDFTPVQAALQGYFWRIPIEIDGKSYENRGVYDSRFYAHKERAALPKILAEHFRELGEELDLSQIEGHPIHLFSPRNLFSKERILLVGDAAGVDPLLGEGIGPALGYGEPAARAIQQAFAHGDFSFSGYRRRFLLSVVGRALLLRYAIARVGYRYSHQPQFMRNFWRLGALIEKIYPKVRP